MKLNPDTPGVNGTQFLLQVTASLERAAFPAFSPTPSALHSGPPAAGASAWLKCSLLQFSLPERVFNRQHVRGQGNPLT